MQTNYPLKKESLLIFWSMAFAVLVIDSIAFITILNTHKLSFAVSTHLSLIFILLAWILYSYYSNRHYRFTLLLLLMSAVTGPFGAIVCIVASIGYLYRLPSAPHPSEWIASFFSDQETKETDNVLERITLGLDNVSIVSGVEPFQDILSGGTMIQKQNVIAKITRHFNPQFAPLLLQAAKDPNAAVRVQAAAALAKIEHHFMAQCMQLEKLQKSIPNTIASGLQLAKVYEDYANTGLVDEKSKNIMLTKAIKIYESYLEFHKDYEIKLRLARLLLNQNESEKALALLGSLINSNDANSVVVLWYMETLFRLRKFKELRLMAKHSVGKLTRFDFDITGRHIEIENALFLWHSPITNHIENIQPVSEKSYAT